mmetsp:Transcript_113584/g.308545  ORF Transcript_113584/g.308545 Transcript_113584/m.308545 type:complete len:283 (+) Transcript_113584:492-1340(+)
MQAIPERVALERQRLDGLLKLPDLHGLSLLLGITVRLEREYVLLPIRRDFNLLGVVRGLPLVEPRVLLDRHVPVAPGRHHHHAAGGLVVRAALEVLLLRLPLVLHRRLLQGALRGPSHPLGHLLHVHQALLLLDLLQVILQLRLVAGHPALLKRQQHLVRQLGIRVCGEAPSRPERHPALGQVQLTDRDQRAPHLLRRRLAPQRQVGARAAQHRLEVVERVQLTPRHAPLRLEQADELRRFLHGAEVRHRRPVPHHDLTASHGRPRHRTPAPATRGGGQAAA